MERRAWANGTMYTHSEKKFTRTHQDGTQEIITLERVNLVHPRKDQIVPHEYGPTVRPRSIQFYMKKTGRPVKPRSHYYTLSQVFHGGPGAAGDALGGFCSGVYRTYYTDTGARNVEKDLIKDGYALS
jgi:hypothetical protein